MNTIQRLNRLEKDIEELKKYLNKDDLQILIQKQDCFLPDGNGTGIEILGKGHQCNVHDSPVICLKGRIRTEKQELQINSSIPALKKAISKFEELFGEIK